MRSEMKTDTLLKLVLTALLTISGYFLMQTFATIKSLEKDVVAIREKITALEATRLSRKDVLEMISDYHFSHPCQNARQLRNE